MTEKKSNEMNNIEKKHLTIMKGNVFQPKGTQYRVDSLSSLVDLVKAKGDPQKTVLFYYESGIDVVLDDTIEYRTKDLAFFSFRLSPELEEWNALMNRWVTQKILIDFLTHREPRELTLVDEVSLINQLEKLKLATTIVGDYQYHDRNNFTVMFKVEDGEGSATLPSVIEVRIPFFLENKDNFSKTIEIELELSKPRSADEKPQFKMTCPKYSRYYREAVENEISKLKQSLSGYLILAGANEIARH